MLCKRRLPLLIIPLLLLPAIGFHTVETLLVLVGVRLGISLVLVILGRRLPLTIRLCLAFLPFPPLPLSTETSIGTMSFSLRVLATVDTSVAILPKELKRQ